MTTPRTLTASEAKASLGEVLASLADGPVEITRNGRPVALLSAAAPRLAADAGRLPALAALYAAGKVSWPDIADATGAAFGDLLLELARQGLALPQVRPTRSPAQERRWRALLRRAAAR